MDKRIRNGRKSSADVAQKPNLDAFSFNNHVWLCFVGLFAITAFKNSDLPQLFGSADETTITLNDT